MLLPGYSMFRRRVRWPRLLSVRPDSTMRHHNTTHSCMLLYRQMALLLFHRHYYPDSLYLLFCIINTPKRMREERKINIPEGRRAGIGGETVTTHGSPRVKGIGFPPASERLLDGRIETSNLLPSAVSSDMSMVYVARYAGVAPTLTVPLKST